MNSTNSPSWAKRHRSIASKYGLPHWRGLCFLILSLVLVNQHATVAQSYPANGYYALLAQNSVYHMGEMRDAQRSLVNLYRQGYREGNVRWIDSAAYQALAGEVSYQMGDYESAMDAFDESAAIYLNMYAWPTRVDWSKQQVTQIDTNAVRAARINWGQPTRPAAIGRFPNNIMVRFGRNIVVPNDQGNTIIPQERLVPVDVFEICRAFGLGLHRRDQILGPLSTVNEGSRLLRTQLNEARSLVNAAIPATLGNVLYGIAAAGDGQFVKSSEILNANLQINGMDHPLTPLALMQIGYNSFMVGEYRAAKQTLLEASYSAAYFQQYDVFRESLLLAGKAHTAVNRDQAMPELNKAAEWARLHGLRMAQSQFAVVSAENDIENGNPESALKSLAVAKGLIRTTTLAKSAQAQRILLLEQISQLIGGTDNDVFALRRTLEAYRQMTLWWYRVEYLRTPAKRRNLTTATLSVLVKAIARDPLPDDWERDPIDTLAFLTGDRSDFVMGDLDLQVSKRNFDDALMTSELIRRMEFLYQLPLGGRLMAIRELISRQPKELTPDLQRRQIEVRARFNDLEPLVSQSEKLRTALDQMPINPGEDQEREWAQLVEQWQGVNQVIERGFVNLSVRREATPLLFPPAVDLETIQSRIPDKTLCLVIKQSAESYHVFLVTQDTVAFQTSLNPGSVNKALQGLAKFWGHTNPNAVLQKELMEDKRWKDWSNKTLQALVPKSTPEFWNAFDELVVIPDGKFWYLPFETLALEPLETSELMLDKVAIRYAPSLGLAFGQQAPRRINRIGFFPGLIDAKDDSEKAEQYREEFVATWPRVMEVESSPYPTSVTGPLLDGMVVWNSISSNVWPSMAGAKPRKNELYKTLDLDAWPYLPNHGPDLLMISGGNTAITSGLRSRVGDNGQELSFYTTLLLASGCKSMVLPRWRTAGDLPYQFQILLAKELQKTQPTANAFRQAIQEVRKETLDPENQPRLRLSKTDTDLVADHPFLWAGYMVVDSGQWYQDPDQEQAPEGLLQAGGSKKADEEMPEAKPTDGEAKAAEGEAKPPGQEEQTEPTKPKAEGGQPATTKKDGDGPQAEKTQGDGKQGDGEKISPPSSSPPGSDSPGSDSPRKESADAAANKEAS